MENTAEVKLDLAALAAPEGTDPTNFENFVSKEAEVISPSTSFSNLPNLDPVKEPGQENTDIATNTSAGKEADGKVPGNAAETAGKDTINTPEAKWFEKPFKALQKRLGLTDEEFKIPEGLTEENYDEKYNELLWEHTEREGEESKLHPELKKINDLIQKGVDYKEALGAYERMNNLESLSDKELVALSLKQQFGKTEQKPDGWDEDKINERIAKMDNSGYLEIEAQRLRDNIKFEKENINARYEQSIKEQRKQEFQKLESARTEQINKSLEYLSGIKDVYGLPVSKAEINEFKDDFKYLVTPNEKGISPMAELLQSNENLVKIAYFLRKGDDKLRTALTKAKEDAKKSIIDKLDDEPKVVKKVAPYLNEAAIDLEKLSQGATG
jgi:hypothetical protein